MAVYRPNNDQIPPPDCLVQAGIRPRKAITDLGHPKNTNNAHNSVSIV